MILVNRLIIVSALLFAGCDFFRSSDSENIVHLPAIPSIADSSFKIRGIRKWYIIPNALDSSYGEINISASSPGPVKKMHLFIDTLFIKSCTTNSADCNFTFNVSNLQTGEHRLLLSADNNDTAFAAPIFQVSHPLFAVVSCDWDEPSIFYEYLYQQDTLHANHPDLRITHFAGPYMFTDPYISPNIINRQVGWLKNARESWQDEIGLHIHPYCHFVRAAGLSCIVNDPWDGSPHDSSGYLISCHRYAEQDFSRLLQYADSLFVSAGLGKPTSFRAGGWTADISTIRALSKNNYSVDASSVNVPYATELALKLEPLYNWAKTNWAHISDTSQPYYPNQTDISSNEKPQLSCLEVPDNGVLADYVTAAEMIGIYKAIRLRKTLNRPKQLSIGYHPDSFSRLNFDRIDSVLDTIDTHLAKYDTGPVIFATMSELPKVWPY